MNDQEGADPVCCINAGSCVRLRGSSPRFALMWGRLSQSPFPVWWAASAISVQITQTLQTASPAGGEEANVVATAVHVLLENDTWTPLSACRGDMKWVESGRDHLQNHPDVISIKVFENQFNFQNNIWLIEYYLHAIQEYQPLNNKIFWTKLVPFHSIVERH